MAALDLAQVRDGVDEATVAAVAKLSGKYKYGWNTDIETDYAPMGLNEDIVRLISAKNGEPEWLLEWRLAAYKRWLKMEEPRWAMLNYPDIDYQDQFYYATPKSMAKKMIGSTSPLASDSAGLVGTTLRKMVDRDGASASLPLTVLIAT